MLSELSESFITSSLPQRKIVNEEIQKNKYRHFFVGQSVCYNRGKYVILAFSRVHAFIYDNVTMKNILKVPVSALTSTRGFSFDDIHVPLQIIMKNNCLNNTVSLSHDKIRVDIPQKCENCHLKLDERFKQKFTFYYCGETLKSFGQPLSDILHYLYYHRVVHVNINIDNINYTLDLEKLELWQVGDYRRTKVLCTTYQFSPLKKMVKKLNKKSLCSTSPIKTPDETYFKQVKYPDYWKTYITLNNLKTYLNNNQEFLVSLSKNSEEYFHFLTLVWKSFCDREVDHITVNINPKLFGNYQRFVNMTKYKNSNGTATATTTALQRKSINEMYMFHGTSHKKSQNILRHGFRSIFVSNGQYGRGMYFSTNAAYSLDRDYAKPHQGYQYLLLCRVYVGRCVEGRCDMPPEYDLFESMCNSLKNPTIICTTDDHQVYPEALIKVKCNSDCDSDSDSD